MALQSADKILWYQGSDAENQEVFLHAQNEILGNLHEVIFSTSVWSV